MSRRLRAEVEADLEQLGRLVAQVRPLAARVEPSGPDTVEIAALGAMVHAFYNGIENTLKRIAVGLEGGVSDGGDWHAALLEGAAEATRGRGAVLSRELVDRLKPYLQFRHVFRHAYTFDLRWPKMKPLVEDLDPMFREVEKQVRTFLALHDGEG